MGGGGGVRLKAYSVTGVRKFRVVKSDSAPPLCNLCLGGPIDLKLGMWIALGKVYRNCQKMGKTLKELAKHAKHAEHPQSISTCPMKMDPSKEMP